MDISNQKVYPCFGKYIDDPESNITGIFLPDTLINIKALAFGACQHLEGVSIPASVVYIGQSAWCLPSRMHCLKAGRWRDESFD